MRMDRSVLSLAFIVAAAACSRAHAQAPGPSSGDLTVRMSATLDSNIQRAGQGSMGTVVRSSNPAIPRGTAALVQIVADTSGGFTVQLARLSINGQMLRTASTAPSLAGGFLGKANNALRKPGEGQDAVSGLRVFLAPNTDVKFTLTEPASAAPATPARPQAVQGPSVWRTAPSPFGANSNAVTIEGNATNGPLHGHVHLMVSCANDSSYAMTYFTVAKALSGHSVDDYNAVSDTTAIARLNVADTPEMRVNLSGNSGDDNPVRLNASGIDDTFYSAANASKKATLTVSPPDSKGPPLLATFDLPADASPMLAVVTPCFERKKKEEADRLAKVVASCPVRPDKEIVHITIKTMPGGREIMQEGDDSGSVWDLAQRPLRKGEHIVMTCIYGPTGSQMGKTVAPADRLTVPVPATAATCETVNPIVQATCSRK